MCLQVSLNTIGWIDLFVSVDAIGWIDLFVSFDIIRVCLYFRVGTEYVALNNFKYYKSKMSYILVHVK